MCIKDFCHLLHLLRIKISLGGRHLTSLGKGQMPPTYCVSKGWRTMSRNRIQTFIQINGFSLQITIQISVFSVACWKPKQDVVSVCDYTVLSNVYLLKTNRVNRCINNENFPVVDRNNNARKQSKALFTSSVKNFIRRAYFCFFDVRWKFFTLC